MSIRVDYDLLCTQINFVGKLALLRDDPEERDVLLSLAELLDTIVDERPFPETNVGYHNHES